jgi:hypothetical protein
MLKLSIQCTRFKSNYTTCTGRSREYINVAAVEALRKKERLDKTQFTTKIDGFFSFPPNPLVSPG